MAFILQFTSTIYSPFIFVHWMQLLEQELSISKFLSRGVVAANKIPVNLPSWQRGSVAGFYFSTYSILYFQFFEQGSVKKICIN